MKTIETDRGVVSYAEAGRDDADTVVLLTGWSEDCRLFKNVMPVLAADFHVLSPNWRGHDPGIPLTADFGANDLAEDLLAFLAAKRASAFHLVSSSHGCWVNIEICDRLGTGRLDRTVILDWLLEPHPNFLRQVAEGRDPALYEAARKSMFDEWASATDNVDVLNHIYDEMPSFGGDMWMRANREIEESYRRWGSPIRRMQAMSAKPEVLHIFSQPPSAEYKRMQEAFAAENSWFHPKYVPGKTHFPGLENGPVVGGLIGDFLASR